MTPYDDILYLSRPESKRKKMARSDRAAQFSPFSALTGYDETVKEQARLTDTQTELCEYETEQLNKKLCHIRGHISERPAVTVTYFRPDDKKEGGAYLTVTGHVKHIDEEKNQLLFVENHKIDIASISDIHFPKTK